MLDSPRWYSPEDVNMSLASISVILVKTRFPENIGMAARACANMGCKNLVLVEPFRWDFLKAEPLATSAGASVLRKIMIFPDLAQAVAAFNLVVGTTARLGGWRRGCLRIDNAAAEIGASCACGRSVAIVFGPEDRGLTNEEVSLCDMLLNIPTEAGATSLNLAQAVLLVLYECRKAVGNNPELKRSTGAAVSSSDMQRLERNLKECLCRLHCLGGKNPDYYFRLWKRMLARLQPARPEYDSLMGLCRQIRNMIH